MGYYNSMFDENLHEYYGDFDEALIDEYYDENLFRTSFFPSRFGAGASRASIPQRGTTSGRPSSSRTISSRIPRRGAAPVGMPSQQASTTGRVIPPGYSGPIPASMPAPSKAVQDAFHFVEDDVTMIKRRLLLLEDSKNIELAVNVLNELAFRPEGVTEKVVIPSTEEDGVPTEVEVVTGIKQNATNKILTRMAAFFLASGFLTGKGINNLNLVKLLPVLLAIAFYHNKLDSIQDSTRSPDSQNNNFFNSDLVKASGVLFGVPIAMNILNKNTR